MYEKSLPTWRLQTPWNVQELKPQDIKLWIILFGPFECRCIFDLSEYSQYIKSNVSELRLIFQQLIVTFCLFSNTLLHAWGRKDIVEALQLA